MYFQHMLLKKGNKDLTINNLLYCTLHIWLQVVIKFTSLIVSMFPFPLRTSPWFLPNIWTQNQNLQFAMN